MRWRGFGRMRAEASPKVADRTVPYRPAGNRFRGPVR